MASLHLAQEILDIIYPVGSIYMSVNSTNPSTYFGGTWSAIAQGRTLVGVNASDTDFASAGKTGGEKKHTLTIAEMPSHSHAFRVVLDKRTESGSSLPKGANSMGDNNGWSGYVQPGGNGAIQATGNSNSHNNLQPYYCVYIFKRIS